MVRRDGAETRKDRIAQIAQSVHAALYQNKEAGWISLSQIVAKTMIDTGLTKSKVLEYLQLLNDAGQFELSAVNDRIDRKRV
jgi:hypothetical protein